MADEKYDLTAAQCRAARALLGWSQDELAQKSGVGVSTIRTFEPGKTKPIKANLSALRHALEVGGVALIADCSPSSTGGPGVRLVRAAEAN